MERRKIDIIETCEGCSWGYDKYVQCNGYDGYRCQHPEGPQEEIEWDELHEKCPLPDAPFDVTLQQIAPR